MQHKYNKAIKSSSKCSSLRCCVYLSLFISISGSLSLSFTMLIFFSLIHSLLLNAYRIYTVYVCVCVDLYLFLKVIFMNWIKFELYFRNFEMCVVRCLSMAACSLCVFIIHTHSFIYIFILATILFLFVFTFYYYFSEL